MRIFLTGALGYIGSVINHFLTKEGFKVVGVDAGFFPENCFYREDVWQSRSAIEKLLRKDTRDITSDDLRGCDAVVDFAGLANDPSGELNPQWTDEINHQACARLARMAKENGIPRYIFASTCSVYGARGESLLTEDSEVDPVSAYAKAKVATEQDVKPLADRKFHPTILRNATAFGASPRMRFDLVVNNLTGYGYTTKTIRIISDGTAWRPNVHIEDIARAVLTTLTTPTDAVGGEVFNVGMELENHKVHELANIVSEALPGCKVEIAKGATKDPRSYRVSFKKISKLKTYNPQWSVKKGIQELKDAFEKNNLTYENFQASNYHNLKRLQELIASGKLDDTLRFRPE
ncbi:MAG: NAD-dependent epimerase/dehydratase family protein [Candidatus Bathyarchaeia archaeon]